MRRFRFNLETVLTLRAFREREAELELARITGQCVIVDNQLKEAAEEKARVFRNRFRAGRSLADLQVEELYLVRLERRKEKLVEERAKLELVRLDAQKKYLAASKDKKVLEKLREKRTAEYRKLVETENAKTLDDIANNMRHGDLAAVPQADTFHNDRSEER